MSTGSWSVAWFEEGVTDRSMLAWRGVEAQHIVSTMRLVDTADEQDVLETLLERSKPPLPPMKAPKHYLLSTPFRYRLPHLSRFPPAGTLGLWYGAEELYAACTEVDYWRHRFILDSTALLKTELLTEHTFFQASVDGAAIDLMRPPWDAVKPAWTHGSDYSATHAVAEAARDRDAVDLHESVRAPGGTDARRCWMSRRSRWWPTAPHSRPGTARRPRSR